MPLKTPAGVNVTPPGRGSGVVMVGVGKPLAITENEPAVSTVKDAVLALRIVGGPLTFCVSIADVLPPKLASPAYTAVMGCEPAVSALVVNVATPAASAPLPMGVPASRKVTVPVAVADDTVAVKVTESPTFEGFNEELRIVVVVGSVYVTVMLT